MSELQTKKANKSKKDFRGQRDGEHVVLLIHRHPAALVYRIIKPIILLLILIYIIIRVESNPTLFMFLFGMIILSFFWIIYDWFCWWLDVFIITDQRIIDVDQSSMFSKRVSEASWDKVQDITYEVKGVLPTLLNYGSVNIQTASATSMICFSQIGNPEKIQDLITKVQKDPQYFTDYFNQKETGFVQKKVD